MLITYVGPFSAGVEIVATGQHAAPGDPIEVSDELGASLCEQAVWIEAEETPDQEDE